MINLRTPPPGRYVARDFLRMLAAAASAAHLKEAWREGIARDRYLLAYLLGYDSEGFEWDPIHLWMYRKRIPELRATPGCQSLWLCPRGTYKTALEEVDITWDILHFPDMTQGIGSWSAHLSTAICRQVRANLMHEAVRWLYPDVVWARPESEAEKWTETEFTVKRRRVTHDATLKAFSIESMPTGLHFDRTRLDDVVNRQNAFTEDSIEKVKSTMKDIRSFRATTQSQIEVKGTLWDPTDWHHELMGKPGWIVERHPAYVEDPKVHKDAAPCPIEGLGPGDCLYPSRKPVAELEADLEDMGPFQFSAQMLLRVSEAEGALWGERFKNYFDPDRDISASFNCYILVDLATEHGEDESTVAVGLKDPDRIKYVVDGRNAPDASPSQIADWIYMFEEAWGGTVIIEEISGFQYFDAVMLEAAQRHGRKIDYRRIRKRAESKHSRIRSIDPEVRSGRLRYRDPRTCEDPEQRRFFQTLEREGCRYPNVSLRDILDNLADLCNESVTPKLVPPDPEATHKRRLPTPSRAKGAGSYVMR